MSLLVGPVIGLVSDSTARILIEVQDDSDVTITLTPVGGGAAPPRPLSSRPSSRAEIAAAQPTGPGTSPQATVRVTQSLRGKRPSIYIFHGLKPDTKYQCTVDGHEQPPSAFQTFPTNITLENRLNFGIVSCNNYRITKEMVPPEGDVWTAVAERVQAGQLHVLLHLGDQVYGDDDWSNMEDGKLKMEDIIGHCRFAQAKDLLDSKPPESWPEYHETIIEMYREAYREAWGHPPTRLALANCCNIMQYDDHDIRDDLGDKEPEFDPTTAIYLICQAGRRACLEYQRALHEDIPFTHPRDNPVLRRENHIFHRFGEYGVMFVDTRGAKTFARVEGDERPFVTTPQWTDIRQSLAPGGMFDGCRLLIWATQIPIVFFPSAVTEKIAKKADDFEGMWSYKGNHAEQMEMLNLLWAWKSASPERELVLTGGDVHLGGFSTIKVEGTMAFDQMIVGPVSNQTLNKIAFGVTNMIKESNSHLDPMWSFEHFGWTNMRNVGVIYTMPGPPGGCLDMSHIVGGKTLEEHRVRRPEEGRSWSDSFKSWWK